MRTVVLIVVLPVRMVWDVLAGAWHTVDRVVLPPLGRALAALGAALGRGLEMLFGGIGWLVGTLIGVLVLIPLKWLYTSVFTPLGHGLRWIGTALLAPAARGLGTGLTWLFITLLVVPVAGLWRYAIVPVMRATAWSSRRCGCPEPCSRRSAAAQPGSCASCGRAPPGPWRSCGGGSRPPDAGSAWRSPGWS
ncbi:hypothetical protein SBADM41S_01441 [Streptomyces badius]